jgi:hypothetical protein
VQRSAAKNRTGDGPTDFCETVWAQGRSKHGEIASHAAPETLTTPLKKSWKLEGALCEVHRAQVRFG